MKEKNYNILIIFQILKIKNKVLFMKAIFNKKQKSFNNSCALFKFCN